MMETQDKRLVLSILQELTVAAVDLFDPHHPMGSFLERVAERLGCLAVLVLDEGTPSAPRLLDAAGLSARSRTLPVSDGPLPYPELARPGLVIWRFARGGPAGNGASSLILCFDHEPASADQYRGMVRRLATTFQTALGHRLLYARTIESEQSAQRAIRAREELVAIVSHDLKTPLATISMSTSLLLDQLSPDQRSDVRRSIERIQRSADRMGRLIRDLLDLAKLDEGHLSIDLAPHETGRLISDAIEPFRGEATARSLHLEQQVAPGAEWAQCDRERILQVIANLVGNAVKFTPEGGGIFIRAERAERELIVSVRDTGRGIAEDERARIFDRYWQAKETAHKGTGLGLSIAKGLVELHGGRIWVVSQVGAGSTFFFTLPAP
jgi:signal transduction histidine kinase